MVWCATIVQRLCVHKLNAKIVTGLGDIRNLRFCWQTSSNHYALKFNMVHLKMLATKTGDSELDKNLILWKVNHSLNLGTVSWSIHWRNSHCLELRKLPKDTKLFGSILVRSNRWFGKPGCFVVVFSWGFPWIVCFALLSWLYIYNVSFSSVSVSEILIKRRAPEITDSCTQFAEASHNRSSQPCILIWILLVLEILMACSNSHC